MTQQSLPRVVYLRNFLSPDSVAICQSWSKRKVKLTVLVSVAMERNRAWEATDGGLDLQVQRTWTLTRTDKHPSGFADVNYVHIPLDTMRQLRRIDPDVVVSAELGMRSIFAAFHCMISRFVRLRRGRCRLVLAISTTPLIEESRSGILRGVVRRWLVQRADALTFHGPECRQLLVDLGAESTRLFEFQYSADPVKIHRGEIRPSRSPISNPTKHVAILTVGQLIARKGVLEGLNCLTDVARMSPDLEISWTLLGGGPLLEPLRSMPLPPNLAIDLRGNVDSAAIREAYASHEMMFFPTRGDEWGLVVDEALHSGLVVIGNPNAQASVTLIRHKENGYMTKPDDATSLAEAVNDFASKTSDQRLQMRQCARNSIADRTPAHSADQIMAVIEKLIG